MNKDIQAYNEDQEGVDEIICAHLAQEIDASLAGAESKIWHGSHVWFIDGNPIAGYGKLKDCVRLLFWSGQSFETPGLSKEGSFKAAEIRFTAADQIDTALLRKWLKESISTQWDYKNIIKRKGKLIRL